MKKKKRGADWEDLGYIIFIAAMLAALMYPMGCDWVISLMLIS